MEKAFRASSAQYLLGTPDSCNSFSFLCLNACTRDRALLSNQATGSTLDAMLNHCCHCCTQHVPCMHDPIFILLGMRSGQGDSPQQGSAGQLQLRGQPCPRCGQLPASGQPPPQPLVSACGARPHASAWPRQLPLPAKSICHHPLFTGSPLEGYKGNPGKT